MGMSRLDLALKLGGLPVPATGAIAVLRANAATDYTPLGRAHLHLINSFRPEYDRLETAGYSVSDRLEDTVAACLVHLTRSKQETLGLIATAFQHTNPGGVIIVDGPRTDGIDSVLKNLRAHVPIDESLSKYHGRIFWMTRPATLPDVFKTWQSALIARKNADGFLTAPGMFSPDHADPGSELLASHFTPRLSGALADFGAGWGWLSAAALKTGAPDTIDLYEAEKTALDAARTTLGDAPGDHHWVDIETLNSPKRYDAIIMNPPFHQGRAASPALGLEFIKKAAQHLKPSGSLWMVANRQLPYEAGLEHYFNRWQLLEQTQYFKAFRADKPTKKPSPRTTARAIHRR